MVLLKFLLFLLGCIVLVKSADILVNSLSRIAAYFRVSDFVVGFMIMAFATSIPDLTIGLSSALASTPENPLTSFTLGNVIGANIIELTLVVGIVAIIRKDIKIESRTVRTDTIYMFLIMTVPMVLMMDGGISRTDGLILFFTFLVYMLRLLSQSKGIRSKGKTEDVSAQEFRHSIVFLLISLFMLFLGANLLVNNGRDIATYLGVSPMIVGLFMISLGTTLPELTFETKAVLTKHEYMALGDLIGSIIANSTLVLGVTAMIYPINITGSASLTGANDFLIYLTSAFFMLVVAFLFMTFIEAEKHILWQEGVGLILLYALFIIVELSIYRFEVTQVMG